MMKIHIALRKLLKAVATPSNIPEKSVIVAVHLFVFLIYSKTFVFLQLGLQRYHGVGILGFNSAEWFIADIGAILAG